ELPVGLGLEVVLADAPFVSQDYVTALIFRDRNVGRGNVRHLEQQAIQLCFDAAELLVEDVDRRAELLAAVEEQDAVCVGSAAYLASKTVALGLEVVGLLDVLAAETIELDYAIDRCVRVAVLDSFADRLRIFANELKGKHFNPRIAENQWQA